MLSLLFFISFTTKTYGFTKKTTSDQRRYLKIIIFVCNLTYNRAMRNNYLLTFTALLVMQLSVGQIDFFQDISPPVKKSPKISHISDKENQGKEIEDFKMYPNPVTNGFVNITSKKNLSKEIRIYDVLANEVLRSTMSSTSLNVSSLDPGVYLLKATEGNTTSTRKLVVR